MPQQKPPPRIAFTGNVPAPALLLVEPFEPGGSPLVFDRELIFV